MSEKNRVFRLRNLPGHVDRLSTAELFASCLDNIAPYHIRISSLAQTVDPWARLPTKIATLVFTETSVAAHFIGDATERTFHVPGLPKPLILDHHFRGLTPLNDPNPEEHQQDCIVLSGLASHPMGSWQPRGDNKSFMWIRDELPQYLPTIRFILYGYDTTLSPSNSFQTIPDLANSLIDVLRADGWTSPAAKPLIFLAHSLGGVLLKQALLMLAGSGQKETFITSLIKGIIFFGVPSQGMNIQDIATMIGDQPNKESLIMQISTESDYLPQLERQFCGISYLRQFKSYWAYETKTSFTIVLDGGKYSRSGSNTILVTRDSATGGRCLTDPSLTIQIDESHSDMVKFTDGDHRIRVIASKLVHICGLSRIRSLASSIEQPALHVDELVNQPSAEKLVASAPPIIREVIPDLLLWGDEASLKYLSPPELNYRMHQIDLRAGHTFDWIYDKPSVGLPQWLQRGQGIYWISGKPGSGKSTMMKFIYNDPRTSELLHQWNSTALQITAKFFFNYRGNVLQKSFEGLLRSIIFQILEAEPSLIYVLHSAYEEQYLEGVAAKGLGTLQSDIYQLVKLCNIGEDWNLDSHIRDILKSQDVRSSLQSLLRDRYIWNIDIENELIKHKDVLLNLEGVELLRCISDHGRNSLQVGENFDLQDLIMSWQKNLNLEPQLRQLLKYFGIGLSSNTTGARSLIRKFTEQEESRATFVRKVEESIRHLVQRHKARNEVRMAIQGQDWSKRRLEELLRRICGQKLFDLDLCLILDALDEYDGRPEFISGFLKDFAQEALFPRTRVRILFSSRPWNVFREEFGACQGFKIHEHTENDIRTFCTTSIFDSCQFPQYLLPLVEEIVSRSSGVFLWVKLVLRDLFAITVKVDQADEIQEELRKTLDSLPDQLDEYYTSIIERISTASRWDTYVALECLARSETFISVHQLVDIIACSMARRWPDASQLQHQERSADENECYIREISGGLVDIRISQVQLMHQTVKDFIEDPQFRDRVLGYNRSQITRENGHSFLTKYHFLDLSLSFNEKFSFHAREAERTTGLSQYQFFATAPTIYFNAKGVSINDERNVSPRESPYISSTLSLAVFAGLQLLIEEAHGTDRRLVETCSESLIGSLLYGMLDGLSSEDALKVTELLIARNLRPERDPGGLGELMTHLWRGTTGPESVNRWGHSPEDYVKIASKIVECLQDIEISIEWKDERTRSLSGTILHLCPANIAKQFLGRGANPNTTNSDGLSPLDHIFARGSIHSSSVAYLYELSLLLTQYGGKLQATSKDEWNLVLQTFENAGYETMWFVEYGLYET